MAFVAVFFLAIDCTPRTKAVAPLGLAEAALASFVASTGYKMYIDNGTGSDLTAMVSQLYDTYLHTHPEAMTLSLLLQGNYIFVDDLANIIVTQEAATWFQDFCSWIKSEYSVAVGGAQTVVISTGDGIYSYNGVQSYKYDCTYPVTIGGVTWYYSEIITGYYSFGSTNFPTYLIASSPVSLYATYFVSNSGPRDYFAITTDSAVSCTVNFFSENDSGSKVKMLSDFTVSSGRWEGKNAPSSAHYDDALLVSSVIPTSVSPSALTTDSSTGLSVSLANDIADKLGEITANPNRESVLVIDVGADPAIAGEGGLAPDATTAEVKAATEQNVIDTVIDIYNPATGVLPVEDSIVSAEVVDTPVQTYPDFDDLGLPELGLALVERFPFCIPYDFVHLVTLFDADPVAPYIRIDLFPSSFRQRIGLGSNQAVFYLDMTQEEYQTMGVIIRWGTLVGFCVGLLFITRKLIWSS